MNKTLAGTHVHIFPGVFSSSFFVCIILLFSPFGRAVNNRFINLINNISACVFVIYSANKEEGECSKLHNLDSLSKEQVWSLARDEAGLHPTVFGANSQKDCEAFAAAKHLQIGKKEINVILKALAKGN